MRNAFPAPIGELNQKNLNQIESQELTVSNGESPLETKRNETESETETKASADAHVTVWPSFEDFWNLYDKKQDRPKCEKKWGKIKQAAREKIMEHIELYTRSTPELKYRKNPLTYLNNESWNDEIIPQVNGKQVTAQGTLDRLNSYTN
jgi:hypothetical protein